MYRIWYNDIAIFICTTYYRRKQCSSFLAKKCTKVYAACRENELLLQYSKHGKVKVNSSCSSNCCRDVEEAFIIFPLTLEHQKISFLQGILLSYKNFVFTNFVDVRNQYTVFFLTL